MRVDVAFQFKAGVILKKARKPIDVAYRSSTPLEIRELDAGDCPVVARICKNEFRVIDGELYATLNPPDSTIDSDGLSLSAFVASAGEYADLKSFHATLPGARSPGYCSVDRGCDLDDDSEVKTIVSNSRADSVAGMEAWAAGVVALDGQLFRRTSEPVLAINPIQNDHGRAGICASYANLVERDDFLSPFWRPGDRDDVWFYFNFGDHERAEEWCQKVLGAEVADAYPIEVFDPSAFRFAGDDILLATVAVRFLATLKHVDKECDEPAKGSIEELKVAIADWQSESEPTSVLAEAFDRCMDATKEALVLSPLGRTAHASGVAALGFWRDQAPTADADDDASAGLQR